MAEKKKKTRYIPPPETVMLRKALKEAFKTTDGKGHVVAKAKHGIYLFSDYDGEPIYVGQTRESLATRIRRHLTNQRTDAVAMNVLDPFEVADITMWPFFDLDEMVEAATKQSAADGNDQAKKAAKDAAKLVLNGAEYTVHKQAVAASKHKAILNEGDVAETDPVTLPEPVVVRIVPAEYFEARQHPDTRIARRAATIAALARVISEREVSKGLRRTLLTQAQRLEHLASERLKESTEPIPIQKPGEEV